MCRGEENNFRLEGRFIPEESPYDWEQIQKNLDQYIDSDHKDLKEEIFVQQIVKISRYMEYIKNPAIQDGSYEEIFELMDWDDAMRISSYRAKMLSYIQIMRSELKYWTGHELSEDVVEELLRRYSKELSQLDLEPQMFHSRMDWTQPDSHTFKIDYRVVIPNTPEYIRTIITMPPATP